MALVAEIDRDLGNRIPVEESLGLADQRPVRRAELRFDYHRLHAPDDLRRGNLVHRSARKIHVVKIPVNDALQPVVIGQHAVAALFQIEHRTLLRAVVRVADATAVVKTQVVLTQAAFSLDTVAPVVVEMVRNGAVARVLPDAGNRGRARQQQYGRCKDPTDIFQHISHIKVHKNQN